jgi:hypothetical protein
MMNLDNGGDSSRRGVSEGSSRMVFFSDATPVNPLYIVQKLMSEKSEQKSI